MDKFKINISSLKDGQHNFEINISQGELDTGEIELKDGLLALISIYKAGNEYTADINLNGKMKLECDRCLDEYDQRINNDFSIIYKVDFKPEEEKDNDGDIKFISPNTKFIDVKSDIRDFILLSVPMKKTPPEENGVCSYCNRNTEELLNIKRQEDINPVWEKLLKNK